MPLHVPQAPSPALRSVRAALCSSTAVGGVRAPSALRTVQGAVRPELPLPVHEMSGVRNTSAPPRTRLTGWRFLLRPTSRPGSQTTPSGTGHPAMAGGASVGAAEAVLAPDGWMFGGFGEGPYVTSSERALAQAESLPFSAQPRLLSLPELYMLTLWLHLDTTAAADEGTPAPDDVLIPLAPAPPGIPAHQPRRLAELLPLLTHRLVSAPALRTPA